MFSSLGEFFRPNSAFFFLQKHSHVWHRRSQCAGALPESCYCVGVGALMEGLGMHRVLGKSSLSMSSTVDTLITLRTTYKNSSIRLSYKKKNPTTLFILHLTWLHVMTDQIISNMVMDNVTNSITIWTVAGIRTPEKQGNSTHKGPGPPHQGLKNNYKQL